MLGLGNPSKRLTTYEWAALSVWAEELLPLRKACGEVASRRHILEEILMLESLMKTMKTIGRG